MSFQDFLNKPIVDPVVGVIIAAIIASVAVIWTHHGGMSQKRRLIVSGAGGIVSLIALLLACIAHDWVVAFAAALSFVSCGMDVFTLRRKANDDPSRGR